MCSILFCGKVHDFSEHVALFTFKKENEHGKAKIEHANSKIVVLIMLLMQP